MRQERSHISVIGAGNVGSATVNALVASRTPMRLVLLDRTRAKAEGQLWDAEDGIALSAHHEMVATDDYAEIADSDVVIITAGSPYVPGENRPALARRNAATVISIVQRLDVVAPDAVIIVVSKPVDLLTRIAIETSQRDERLLFGSGTHLDSVRLRLQLARALGASIGDVDAMIVGEHGRTAVPLWSRAAVKGVPLVECSAPEQREAAMVAAMRRDDAILTRKGCTTTAIAMCLAEMVGSIVADDGAAYPISVRPKPPYELLPDVALGLPCAIGRNGVHEQCIVSMSEEERFALGLSAATLMTSYEAVFGDKKALAQSA